jgi:Domain of unknown function (DUF4126)
MLPVSLIFTSGVASGVNSYLAVLVLGLIGRFGHVAAIPAVLERPSVLEAAAVLYAGQFVVGKIPVLDSVWDVVHTALRPVVGGAIGVVMAQQAHASTAATIAAAALGGGSALASHVVKTGTRVGVNASPEPFSNIIASLLEDLGVGGLVSFAVFHPLAAAIVAAIVLAVGAVVFALLASRIHRGWQRRREARLQRRTALLGAVGESPVRRPALAAGRRPGTGSCRETSRCALSGRPRSRAPGCCAHRTSRPARGGRTRGPGSRSREPRGRQRWAA